MNIPSFAPSLKAFHVACHAGNEEAGAANVICEGSHRGFAGVINISFGRGIYKANFVIHLSFCARPSNVECVKKRIGTKSILVALHSYLCVRIFTLIRITVNPSILDLITGLSLSFLVSCECHNGLKFFCISHKNCRLQLCD